MPLCDNNVGADFIIVYEDNAEYPLHLCGMVILLCGDCIWLCRRSGLKKNPHLLQSQLSYHVENADSGINDVQSLCREVA